MTDDRHRYPVFIPTKGRYSTPWTIRGLERIGVDFKIVIERQEYEQYAQVVDPSKILVVPHQNQGLTVTRNWIWDYAASLGTPRFWTFDDNIGHTIQGHVDSIYRFNRNLKVSVDNCAPLRVIEDWVDRYENVPIAGMNYFMFASRKTGSTPPLTLNTRVYSNMLIDTFVKDRQGRPFRNVTFYNDDTDLCLRILKDGYCTALFNAFLVYKQPTMKIKGGMTDYYEKTNQRLEFVLELQRAHPDVTKVVRRFGRWHHQVDYRPFKRNRLIKRPGLEIPAGPNEYGMRLVSAPTRAGASSRAS
jgi:hypothetical protein